MVRVQKSFTLPSMTKQSFRDECDVNQIMKRFKNSMGVDYLNRFNGYMDGKFGDFSNVSDYRSAIDQIRQARSVFDSLPAQVRARFRNDPAEFLDFVGNSKNGDEMVSLGLAVKKPIETGSSSDVKSEG